MMFPRILINQTSERLTRSWKASCFSTASLRLVFNPHSCFPLISQFDVNNRHLVTNATVFYSVSDTQTSSTSCPNMSLSGLILFSPVVLEKFRFVYSVLFLLVTLSHSGSL